MADDCLRLARIVSDIGLINTVLRARLKSGAFWHKGTRRVRSLSVENVGKVLENYGKSRVNKAERRVWQCSTAAVSKENPVALTLDSCSIGKSATCVQGLRMLYVHTHNRRFLHKLWSKHCALVLIRTYSGSTGDYQVHLYKSKTAYYDILGVSPNATHAQIKTAYYKQSFSYHPDRNAGSDEATLHFSEINEAYTVLGNKALRKKYDRGLLSSSDLTATASKSSRKDPSSAARSSSTGLHQSDPRRRVMGQEDRSRRVFDFDHFYKAHYGEQLQRERNKMRREEIKKNNEESMTGQNLDKIVGLGVAMLLMMTTAILMSFKQR